MLDCPDGWYSLWNAPTCSPCTQGYESLSKTDSESCVQCDVGKYWSSITGNCQLCAPDVSLTYSTGSLSCQCSSGYVDNGSGAVDGTQCVADEFAALEVVSQSSSKSFLTEIAN